MPSINPLAQQPRAMTPGSLASATVNAYQQQQMMSPQMGLAQTSQTPMLGTYAQPQSTGAGATGTGYRVNAQGIGAGTDPGIYNNPPRFPDPTGGASSGRGSDPVVRYGVDPGELHGFGTMPPGPGQQVPPGYRPPGNGTGMILQPPFPGQQGTPGQTGSPNPYGTGTGMGTGTQYGNPNQERFLDTGSPNPYGTGTGTELSTGIRIRSGFPTVVAVLA